MKCSCICHGTCGGDFCKACYMYHGISLRQWKNELEPKREGLSEMVETSGRDSKGRKALKAK